MCVCAHLCVRALVHYVCVMCGGSVTMMCACMRMRMHMCVHVRLMTMMNPRFIDVPQGLSPVV